MLWHHGDIARPDTLAPGARAMPSAAIPPVPHALVPRALAPHAPARLDALARPAFVPAHADLGSRASVADAYAQCRAVARAIARTFYYGSLFLPRAKRRAAWAVYAFCRTADDLADESRCAEDAHAELARWRMALIQTYAGRPRGPVMIAWADLIARYPVPLEPALELLDGVAMDLAGASYPTFDALRTYCYRVAGTVGLLMAPILGYSDARALPHAVDLGIAMQLTNIVRDVGEDAARGRVYVPDDDFARCGYSREELARGAVTPGFARLLECQMARAEALYASGLRGVAYLHPDARLAIALSATLYRGIHARVRRNGYDVFSRRAHVSPAGKLAAIPTAWLAARRVAATAGDTAAP